MIKRQQLLVSKKFLDGLKISCGKMFPCNPETLEKFCGMPVIESSALPHKTPNKKLPPISHDRFCEYGPEDMHWAEPLGLASWQYGEVHAMIMDVPDPIHFRMNYDFRPKFDSRSLIKYTV